MSDVCCGTDGPVAEDLAPWWRDQGLALPAAAGVLWLTGLLLEFGGAEGPYPRILDTGCDYAAVGSVAARRAS